MKSALCTGLLLLTLSVPSYAAEEIPLSGSFASFGLHYFHAFEPGESAPGASASILIRSESLRPLSRTLADSRLGFVLRWNRAHLVDLARIEGGELLLRRYLKKGGRTWYPFLGAGLGQYGVDWDGTDKRRSSWSAILEAGVEWELSRRFLAELDLHNRLIEFSQDSFSGTSLILTLGARIDP